MKTATPEGFKMKITTTHLSNGLTVLAWETGKQSGSPIVYIGQGQTRKRLAQLHTAGITAHVWDYGSGKHIVIDAQPKEN